MKVLSALLLLLCLAFPTHAQEAPTAAPAIKTFALAPDINGAASNSVNLFTGDVALPVNLLSLPGRNGLDVTVSISYSSNVQHVVDTWNLESPTGILGLGWSMDMPKIVADHKQTGTREDDTYYLLEGGSSNRLIRTNSGTDSEGSFYSYETKNYQFWKIKYYYDNIERLGSTSYGSGPNKWVIIKEDGSKFVYGDKNSGRNTLQYTVRWTNWIGNSAQTDGQSQLVHAWNLSEIISTWNNRVTFEYDNVEQFVGTTSGKKQTEASYLKEITDTYGKKVKFFYSEKDAQYIMEPHTEAQEPDAYQEFYERRYLDHIDVLQEAGSKLFSVHFGYGSVNTGTSTAKMLLTSITQKSPADEALPPLQFTYFGSGNTLGFLQTITYPTGGTLSYEYTSGTIGHSNRQFTAQAPSGYAEPKVWVEEDYVVVAWRELSSGNHDTGPRGVKLYAYRWEGEWKEQFLQSISAVSLDGSQAAYYDYKDFQIVAQKDFFAVLSRLTTTNNYALWILYKDPTNRGKWITYSTTHDYGTGLPTLMSGENFVTVGSFIDDDGHPGRQYVFQGNGWEESTLNYYRAVGDHYYTASNNYFIRHNRQNIIGNAEITFSYLTEDRKWVTKDWLSPLLFSSDERSYWHSSNSMAIAMADDNPEFAYRWDLTYTNFIKDSKDVNNNDLFGQLDDDYPYVFMINNSLVGILGRMARFDGKYWRTTTVTTSEHDPFFGDLFTYGEDMVVRPTAFSGSHYNGGRREFDPNQLAWESDYVMTGDEQGNNFASVGNGYYFFGKHYYFRQPDGQWSKIYSYSSISNLRRLSAYPRFDVTYVDGIYPPPLNGIVGVKNGQIGATISIPGVNFLYNTLKFKGSGLGPHTLVSYPNTFSNPEDANSLTLYRFINETVSGNQVDYPVTKITINDGTEDRYTCFDYNFSKATIDPSGNVAQYNEVTVTPECASGTYGYTKTFFYNGLTSTELGIDFMVVDIKWTGMVYETQVFDGSNLSQPVSTSSNTYENHSLDLSNDLDSKVEVGYYVRLHENITEVDGVETRLTNTYDSNTGLVKQTTRSRVPGFIESTSFKYWWESYDNGTVPRSLNILTPVIQKKTSLNNQTVDIAATRWKTWTCTACPMGLSPGLFDSYVWKRNGAEDFTAWDVANSVDADEWKFVSSVKMDGEGQAFESTDIAGRSNNTLFHPTLPYILAKVSNASSDKILYAGFEDCSGNCSTDAKTGLKASLASYTVVLPSAGTYTLTYWSKTTGEWSLNASTVTSNTTIGGGGMIIDEVRLHPLDARMVTYSYDDRGNITAVCDENNKITYIEYDEFGRQKLVRDTEKNILEQDIYNFKQ